MSGYFGSKAGAGVKERIISLMPPHDTYIELFLGSGVVLNHKPRAARQIGVEKNNKTVVKYNYTEGAQIITGCAFDFLQNFDFQTAGRVLIYADPPYLESTRKGGGEYGNYEMTRLDHEHLLFEVLRLSLMGVMVMLSGYESQLYNERLNHLRRLDYQAMTRAGPVTESLWMNFTPARPHWHTYAGENKAQRQAIKRKAARWANKYRACPHGERLAIMAALQGVDLIDGS